MNAPVITQERWQQTRAALAHARENFSDLVSSVDPEAKATDDWTVVDTAAHVTTIAMLYPGLVRERPGPSPIPELTALIPSTTVDTVSRFNEVALSTFTERDSGKVLGLLETSVDDLLAASDGQDPARPVDWIGESQVPLAGVLAHLLNELLIHGRDVAQATRRLWTIDPADAALFFDLFLIGMTSYGYGRLLDTTPRSPRRRIAVEFRSQHTDPVVMVLEDSHVLVERPGEAPVDVRLSFDPTVLNLMLFGRVNPLRAMVTRKVTLTGRRPWMLPFFLRTVHLPA